MLGMRRFQGCESDRVVWVNGRLSSGVNGGDLYSLHVYMVVILVVGKVRRLVGVCGKWEVV